MGKGFRKKKKGVGRGRRDDLETLGKKEGYEPD